MNSWCIYWFFKHIFRGILIFRGLTAQRLYKSFGVKGLIAFCVTASSKGLLHMYCRLRVGQKALSGPRCGNQNKYSRVS
jgi:hypothetical protein